MRERDFPDYIYITADGQDTDAVLLADRAVADIDVEQAGETVGIYKLVELKKLTVTKELV